MTTSEQEVSKSGALKQRPGASVWSHWLRAFWPVLVVVVAGATLFRQAVVDSILSTPHPGLVYTIFGVLAAAVVLSALTLRRYLREEKWARDLYKADAAGRLALLSQAQELSDMGPVYRTALQSDPSVQRHALQQKIEAELFAAEEHLFGRLTLPNYLGGALVGIGLVGTFVGLLGSLADLGSLFASLMNAGNSSADPVAMFSDMLRRLQEPMKGMGTAFVASLYGLMGSLVMGLVTYSVRKSGGSAVSRVREFLRLLAEEQNASQDPDVPWSEAAWEKLFAVMDVERNTLSHSLADFMVVLERQTQVMDGLNAQIRDGNEKTARLSAALQAFDAMGQQIVLGQERVVAHLERVDRSQRQGFESLLSVLTQLSRPPERRLWLAGLWLVVACAIVAVGSTWMNYRLSAQILSQVHAATTEPSPLLAPPTPTPSAPAAAAAPVVSLGEVTVQPGDMLEKIAVRHGVTVAEIRAANPELKNPDRLSIGQRLRLPSR